MQNKAVSATLALVALTAIGIYMVNCRPAWSPEGDQVAFVYVREIDGKQAYGIAVYDVSAGTTRPVLEVREDTPDAVLIPIEVFWPRKQDELVYVLAPTEEEDERKVHVRTCNLRTNEHGHIAAVQIPGVTALSSGAPIALERNRWLWIGGDEGYFRVDTKKGELKAIGKDTIVFGEGKQLFFATPDDKGALSFGTIGTRWRYRERTVATVPAREGATIAPILAMPAKKTLFAYLRAIEQPEWWPGEGMSLVVLDKKGGVLKTVKLPASLSLLEGDDVTALSQAAWNPDGTVLWCAAAIRNQEGEESPVIAEVCVVDESVKLISLDEIAGDDDLTPLHFALSPDGTRLALSAMTDDIAMLLLVDLTSEERTVTTVHPYGNALKKSESEDFE